MSINWYPGHMFKATKEIKEILNKVQVIIEVVDARLPYSSENPVIGRLSADKPTIKLLNKSDLADPKVTQLWIDHFETQQQVKAIAVSREQPEQIRSLSNLIKQMVPARSVGNINAMIMGIPNVGKSTLINTLSGRLIAKTGNEPAVTKRQQRIILDNGVTLFDTPGILWPKVENQQSAYRLATSGAIKDTAMEYDDVGFFAAEYLLKYYPENLKQRYQLDTLPDSELEFLETIGRQRGALVSGGLVNLNKISKILLTEFRDATLGRISLERPAMIEQELIELHIRLEKEAEKKKAKKEARKKRISRR
ncbi:MAG: ribosome biogenesis GTPase YlqF [Gammaproteobacteria bacterium]|nr:ribosome biogenesis GTPase YlqF [Gammaproteobacteria bacterium]